MSQEPTPLKSAAELRLYTRRGKYIPRIAAVHDLCGYGKCSLGTAIPVLSAAGIDVCSVPTAFLSSHTRFAPYTFQDTTDGLQAYIDAWREIGVELDAIYSGFLANPAQVEIIRELGRRNPKALRVVDPVMGDAGRIYPTYDEELCRAMFALAEGADLLTPNLTEAALLCGLPYPGESPDEETLVKLVEKLSGLGSRYILLKTTEEGRGIRNLLFGPGLEPVVQRGEQLPFQLHGTGDLFCSALLAALFAEKTLEEAATFASDLVRHAMEDTVHQPAYLERGVNFELRLGEVASLLGSRRETVKQEP